MNKPYKFHFESLPIKTLNTLPKWSRFPFSTARYRVYKVFPTAEFVIQRLDFDPFFIELFEFISDAPFGMNYEVFDEQYFQFFMLEGDVSFTTPEDFYVTYVKKGHYGMVNNKKGIFKINLKAGRYTALCITFSPEWLSFLSKDQTILKGFLNREKTNYTSLPYCKMESEVGRWLKTLYSKIISGEGALDGLLRYYIARILQSYNSQAEAKLEELPYRLKAYLDDNFTDPEMSLQSIARYFRVNIHTLRNQFYSEFRATPHHYYTCRRLAYAMNLIHEGLPLTKIYYTVGYNDVSALRYALKSFHL